MQLHPPLELELGLRHDDTLLFDDGDRLTVALWARVGAATRIELRCAPDGEEELHRLRAGAARDGFVRWEVTLRPRVRRLRYRFRIERPGGALHLTMVGLSPIDPVDAFDFTWIAPASRGPRWPERAVLYQIFPDRFAQGDPSLQVRDGEWSLRGAEARARRFGDPPLPWAEGKNLDFYGGDLRGVIARLDHLERLGVSGIFLNPIWPARSNHRYDLVDHEHVDPHLGGDEALADLSAALTARGMRLLLDVVLNHTGSAHPWFNRDGDGRGGAYRDPDAPTRSFYRFDEWPHRYRAWMGIDTLPRLDLREPRLVDELVRCMRRLLAPPFSASGLRFDVANMMGRDGDVQHHRPLWSALSSRLREGAPEALLLGEHFFDPDKLLKGDGLDGVMAYHGFTFPLRAWILGRDRRGAESALDGAGLMAHLRQAIGRAGWAAARRSSLHVNTHDLPRLQSSAGGGPTGAAALALATAIQLALPGMPCLYYGDEVGLEGGADPDNRRCMPWDEASWDRDQLERTRAAVRRRRDLPSLAGGGLVDLGSRGDVLAFARLLDGDAPVVIAASRAAAAIDVALPSHLLPAGRPLELTLPPRGAAIVAL